MSEESFRVGKKPFIDNINFPKGFRKSGDFTLAESELLSLYGDTLLGLDSGQIKSENIEEEHFLRVLEQPQKAKTKLELAWLKYIKITREPRQFHTLNSTYPVNTTTNTNLHAGITHTDDEPLDEPLDEDI